MALTVSINPQPLTPAYNKQVFKATSNQTGVSDFKYIVTIQINGGAIFTEYIYAAPDTSMTFDAMEYVKNYISHYFNPSLSLASPCALATNKTVAVEVKLKEYYTSAIQSTNTSNYEAFDACLNDTDFAAYTYTNYLSTGSLPLSGLTTTSVNPDNRIDLTSDNWLHFIRDDANPITNIVLILADVNNNVKQTITIAAIPSSSLDYPTYVVNATPRMFTSPVASDYITVYLKNAANTILVIYTKSISSIDTNYTKYKLYYLDRTGNVCFFNFELLSQESINKKTNSVRLAKANDYSYEREKHVVNTTTQKQIVLNSDWVTEAQSTALEYLFTSPIVWLYLNEVYTPITITETSYKLNKLANESLFNYSFTCEYGQTGTSQRGI